MFTGIVETVGEVVSARADRSNRVLSIRSSLASALKPDQSLSHNGACLTVTAVRGDLHDVTVVAETLSRTTAGDLKAGDPVNLERAMRLDGRLDGHLVQGHVDTVAVCEKKTDSDGSVALHFRHDDAPDFITVSKGSVCLDGVSLTVVDAGPGFFSVALIPYTLEHTTLGRVREGSRVNVEFDLVGKYLRRIAAAGR